MRVFSRHTASSSKFFKRFFKESDNKVIIAMVVYGLELNRVVLNKSNNY